MNTPEDPKDKVWLLIQRIETEAKTPEDVQRWFDHAVSLLGKLQAAEAHEAWDRLKGVNPFPTDPTIEAARARLIAMWS